MSVKGKCVLNCGGDRIGERETTLGLCGYILRSSLCRTFPRKDMEVR